MDFLHPLILPQVDHRFYHSSFHLLIPCVKNIEWIELNPTTLNNSWTIFARKEASFHRLSPVCFLPPGFVNLKRVYSVAVQLNRQQETEISLSNKQNRAPTVSIAFAISEFHFNDGGLPVGRRSVRQPGTATSFSLLVKGIQRFDEIPRIRLRSWIKTPGKLIFHHRERLRKGHRGPVFHCLGAYAV